MDVQIVHQSKVEFKESKNKWKSRWAILENSERNIRPEEIDPDNMRQSNCTSLVIRKHKEGEVRMTIPLYYLCLVDKYEVDKKSYAITLIVANKQTNTAETYLLQCETQIETDVWFDFFQSIVGNGMYKFAIKLPKIIKNKYNGHGWLYFYEDQKFITITTDSKVPVYYGTWPIQLLRRYGGDDPNKFVFESGRRCFGGVNIYHVASSQAYDIRALCNKVSSSRGPTSTTGSLANSTLTGYADTEPRYRNYPGSQQAGRVRPAERPLTVMSNGSVASNTSKRSSGSSNSGGDPTRQQSLDRGVRPMSDTIDSGFSFRSSNNSILSNRSSRGSYSSDINLVEDDSGVDTLDSRGTLPPPPPREPDQQDMYMVMQPNAGGGMSPAATLPPATTMPPISETFPPPLPPQVSEVYETMGQHQEGYTTLRNTIPADTVCNYMVPKTILNSPQSPLPSVSLPLHPAVKKINYPPLPGSPTQGEASASGDYMNMDDYNGADSAAYGNYINLDHAAPAAQSDYMNIDTLSRTLEKGASLDSSYSNMGGVAAFARTQSSPGPSYGNYMNMPTFSEPKKVIPPQPIYDTPTNHVRAYANVDNKLIAMSVSNPIYGNCGPQKLQT